LTLAAAYAETGRFKEAITTAQESSALAETMGQADIATKARRMLATFQSGQPWREQMETP
jgi:hypothetical protein